MVPRVLLGGLVLAALCLGAAPEAPAEEVRQRLDAPMILNLLSRPPEGQERAFSEALRRDAAAPRAARAEDWEMLSDGSARYGRGTLSVIIKNPCPPGDMSHEAGYRPLPGRPGR